MDVWNYLQNTVNPKSLLATLREILEKSDSTLHDRRLVLKTVLGVVEELLTNPKHQNSLALLLPRLEQLTHLVWERLNTGHWAKVWLGWRSTYSLLTSARLNAVAQLVLCNCDYVDSGVGELLLRDSVRLCDLGILLGTPIQDNLLENIAQYLTRYIGDKTNDVAPAAKVPRIDVSSTTNWSLPIPLDPVPCLSCPSIPSFITDCLIPGTPCRLTNCIDNWPALQPPSQWCTEKLLQVAGPRTVPVEIGSKYTDDSWTQKLMTVDQFVTKYMTGNGDCIGYLAQHQLLDQVPSLMDDIEVPDYCYTGDEDNVDVNVWIGPRGTISPPHTDPKNNLLCQVVGTKYVALFPIDQGPNLYPNEGSMMENTSRVDLDNIDFKEFPNVGKLTGYSTVLTPGDMLYIPPKVWHYVRSLEESFSVSFWWQ